MAPPQYQPTANTLYRIESLAFGSFLSLTDVDEGEAPRLIGLQDAPKQCWKFIADPSAKNTYKIVNAAPNPEDIDTHYALNVASPSNSIVTKDADTKSSVWRIAVSADRDHCSIITSYPGQPNSKLHLQANANGTIGIAVDDHRNNQKWRLIEAGTTNEPHTGPTDSEPSRLPQRMPEIPDGLYRVRNILVRRIAFIGPQGYPCATFDTDKTPFEIRYENPNSPYFTMKVSGTNTYVGEINGVVNALPGPFLWYLDKTPVFKESYFICPKASGKMRSWSGKLTEIPGVGDVFNTAPEMMQGKLEGHADLEANCWQRWWVRPA